MCAFTFQALSNKLVTSTFSRREAEEYGFKPPRYSEFSKVVFWRRSLGLGLSSSFAFNWEKNVAARKKSGITCWISCLCYIPAVKSTQSDSVWVYMEWTSMYVFFRLSAQRLWWKTNHCSSRPHSLCGYFEPPHIVWCFLLVSHAGWPSVCVRVELPWGGLHDPGGGRGLLNSTRVIGGHPPNKIKQLRLFIMKPCFWAQTTFMVNQHRSAYGTIKKKKKKSEMKFQQVIALLDWSLGGGGTTQQVSTATAGREDPGAGRWWGWDDQCAGADLWGWRPSRHRSRLPAGETPRLSIWPE